MITHSPDDLLCRSADFTLIRDSATCRTVAAELRATAARLEARADELARARSNARHTFAELQAIVTAADLAHRLTVTGWDAPGAVRMASNRYQVPHDSVQTHFEDRQRRFKAAESRGKEKAARDMLRRGLSQRRIAHRLGMSQGWVSGVQAGLARASHTR